MDTDNKMALGALVCGIASFLFGFCSCPLSFIPLVGGIASMILTGLSFLLAVAAVVTGALGIKAAGEMAGEGKGMAIGGLVLGLVQLLISVGLTITMIVMGGAIAALLMGSQM